MYLFSISNSLQTEQTKEPPNQKAATVPQQPEKPKDVIVSEVKMYHHFIKTINLLLFYLKSLVHFALGCYTG